MNNKAEAAELAAIQRANVLTIEGITKLANDMLVQNTILRKKLAELEEQIAGGIRVYAYQRYAGDWMSTEDYPKYNNATLILDKEE